MPFLRSRIRTRPPSKAAQESYGGYGLRPMPPAIEADFGMPEPLYAGRGVVEQLGPLRCSFESGPLTGHQHYWESYMGGDATVEVWDGCTKEQDLGY